MSNANLTSDPSPEIPESDQLKHVMTEHLPVQDERAFALGDTLDIKTSIILVIIIFLGTQSGEFLASSMPRHWHNIQIASVCLIVIAGLLALLELWPVTYQMRMSHETFVEWVGQVKEFYSHEGVENPEGKIVELIHSTDIQRTRERLTVNRRHNAWKGWNMCWSFYSMMISVLLNLATLLALSTGWRF